MKYFELNLKRFFSIIPLLLVGVLIIPPAEAEQETLTILNWSEYVDPKIVKKFEKKYKVKVREIYYESDDSRDALMLASKGKGYDIIVVNGAKVEQYVKRGWISPITNKQVKNLKHIHKRWLSAFPSTNGNAVPYFWGTLGIAYRKDLVKKPITSWKQLFEPDDDLKGKIIMVRSARELIGLALIAKGYSMNSQNNKEIEEAYTLLEKQKPFVKEYAYISLAKDSSIVNGSVIAATSYNGDTLTIQEHSDNVVYVVPEEGTNLWIDYLSVSKQSTNKSLAYKFLNFINEPKNAAQLAQFLYYASPNKSAEKYLPADFKNDKIIYPGNKTLQKSETIKPIPVKTQRKYNTIYSYIVNE